MAKRNVVNEYGIVIDYEVAENLMDNDLREKIAFEMDLPVSDQEFFDEYCKKHEQEFGEVWEFAKENPCY